MYKRGIKLFICLVFVFMFSFSLVNAFYLTYSYPDKTVNTALQSVSSSPITGMMVAQPEPVYNVPKEKAIVYSPPPKPVVYTPKEQKNTDKGPVVGFFDWIRQVYGFKE